MAKSLKSLLSKINLVDLAVVLVLIAVLMCLMKKMNVVEGLCTVSQEARDARPTAISDMQYICRNLPDQAQCTNPMTWRGCDEIIETDETGERVTVDKCGINMCEESDEKVSQFDERLPSQIVPESRREPRPGTQYIEPDCIIHQDHWDISSYSGTTDENYWFRRASQECHNQSASECGNVYMLGVKNEPSQWVSQCCPRSQEQMRRGAEGEIKLNECE